MASRKEKNSQININLTPSQRRALDAMTRLYRCGRSEMVCEMVANLSTAIFREAVKVGLLNTEECSEKIRDRIKSNPEQFDTSPFGGYAVLMDAVHEAEPYFATQTQTQAANLVGTVVADEPVPATAPVEIPA